MWELACYIIMLFAQLYVRVGILLICEEHLHDRVDRFIKREGCAQFYPVMHFLLKRLYQARKVSGHVFMCWSRGRGEFVFASFWGFYYWILELFRRCGIFYYFILFLLLYMSVLLRFTAYFGFFNSIFHQQILYHNLCILYPNPGSGFPMSYVVVFCCVQWVNKR